MKHIEFEIQGRKHKGYAQRIGQRLWLHFGGRTWSEEIGAPGRKRGKGGAKTAEPGIILAPMPGKVTKLFIGEGDKVQAGDSLLVMEAMKMEYTLKADVAGRVEAIKAATGDQVSLGQMIIRIQEG